MHMREAAQNRVGWREDHSHLHVHIAPTRDSSYSDQTNCCYMGMPTVAWFSKMKSEIQILSVWNVPMFKTLWAKQSLSSCLQAAFAYKTTSSWSLDLERLYSALHDRIWTHTHLHDQCYFKRIIEGFSLSLWTLNIFCILKMNSSMLSVWTKHLAM